VGVDLLAVSRMERLVGNEGFCARVFTPGERRRMAQSGRAAQTAAGVFCAKEAYAKARGVGLCTALFQSVTVTWAENGRPALRSARPDDAGLRFHLSITHDGGFAAAFVVCEEVGS
jgi:holo-[acyl-carrier protein] synthase